MPDPNPDFYLDTGRMDDVIGQLQELARKLETTRNTFTNRLQQTTYGWSGKARVMFDKKAHMLSQEMTDVTQSLYDIADTLLDASEAYMEADTELAKQMDGTNNRY